MNSERDSSITTTETPRPTFTRRQLIAAAAGHAVEVFDWLVYSVFATYIAATFFPSDIGFVGLMATLATFAVGFLFRPLGGIIFGKLADRVGRRPVLVIAIGLMSLGSLVIGITPSFEQIGIAAPVILLLARITQGISAGGEIGTAFTYFQEVAPAGKKGRYASVVYIAAGLSLLVGSTLGVIASTTLSSELMASWGWRIPFLVGALLGLITLVLRRNLAESPEFTKNRDTNRDTSFWRYVRAHPREIIKVFVVSAASSLLFYSIMSGTNVLVQTNSSAVAEAPQLAFIALTVGLVIHTLLLYPFGAWSDRIGAIKLTIIAFILLAVVSLATPWLPLDAPWAVFTVFLAPMIALAAMLSVLPVVLPSLIPSRVRAGAIGIGFGIANAVFGGTAPMLLSLSVANGSTPWFYFYAACFAVAAALVLMWRRDPDPLEARP